MKNCASDGQWYKEIDGSTLFHTHIPIGVHVQSEWGLSITSVPDIVPTSHTAD